MEEALILVKEKPEIDGKFVRIIYCAEASNYHWDTPACVCSLLGKIFKIEKYQGSNFIFKIVSPVLNKFVREREVVLLREFPIGKFPTKKVYIRKNGDFFTKTTDDCHRKVRFDDSLQKWIFEGMPENLDPNEIAQFVY